MARCAFASVSFILSSGNGVSSNTNFFFGASDFAGSALRRRCRGFAWLALRHERREVQARRRQLHVVMPGRIDQQQRTRQLVLAQDGLQVFRFDPAFRELDGAVRRDLQFRPCCPQFRQTFSSHFETKRGLPIAAVLHGAVDAHGRSAKRCSECLELDLLARIHGVSTQLERRCRDVLDVEHTRESRRVGGGDFEFEVGALADPRVLSVPFTLASISPSFALKSSCRCFPASLIRVSMRIGPVAMAGSSSALSKLPISACAHLERQIGADQAQRLESAAGTGRDIAGLRVEVQLRALSGVFQSRIDLRRSRSRTPEAPASRACHRVPGVRP